MQEKGTISIHTENIFPIIKKFLYSDHEIFLRELVSNAVDAVQKAKRLVSLGQFQGELGQPLVSVAVNKEAKTITISDIYQHFLIRVSCLMRKINSCKRFYFWIYF